MSKSTGIVTVKVTGKTLTFKFGMGAWNILLKENGYKNIHEIFGLDNAIVMPEVFHAGLEYYRRVNNPQDEPFTKTQVCGFIDDMDQEDYNKVEDAFITSKYFSTNLKDMAEQAKKITEELKEIQKKRTVK